MTIDLPLKLNNEQVSLSLEILDYATDVVENEAHFLLECPLYNSIRDKFPSLSKKIIPGSLKSFFELDQQVNIRLYLTEATTLRHSRKLTSLKPS